MKLFKLSLRYIVPLLILILLFNITRVSVTDSQTEMPVPFAKVRFFNTDSNGRCSFLDAIFTTQLHVSRIGYEDNDFKVPFGLFVKNLNVHLQEASFEEISTQLTNYSNSFDNYEYTLDTSQKQNKITQNTLIIAKKDGADFYFKITTSDNSGTKSTLVIVKGNDMYKSINGEALVGPLTEQEKEDFSNNNLVFINIQDVLTSVFPSAEPSKIVFNGGSINMKWDDSTIVDLTIGEKGELEKISYTETNSSIQREGSLSITKGGVTISVDENG
jgi:hypothetical protein